MKTIDQLENDGFVGTDANLVTSLFEYGMAWRECETYYRFFYAIAWDNSGNATWFDWCDIGKFITPSEEWDWVDWKEVQLTTGLDLSTDTLPIIVHSLVSYYGFENVFGTSYYGGFEIIE